MLERTRSIHRKLLLVVATTTVAALTVAGIAMEFYDLRTYQQSSVNDLITQADILGRASAPALSFDDPRAAQENLALLKARPSITAAAIYTAKGGLFASYLEDGGADPKFPSLPEADGSRIEGKELVVFKRIVENDEILGTVYLRARYQLFERFKDYLGILSVVMVASLLVAILLSARLNAAVTRPILAISEVARRVVESRDFSLRVAKTTEDEIGSLADGFNAMLTEIGRRAEILEASNRELEQAKDKLRELNAELEQRVANRTAQLEAANKELESFSYSVSHDLRAPVRAIAGFSRLLWEAHADQLDAEAQRKLGIIQSETQRMGDLIDDLLAFSRLGRKEMQRSDLDMQEMARSMYERLHAQHQGPQVEFRLGSLPHAQGDRVLLEQVWANLLSNALKFSAKREKPVIEVSAISDAKEHIYFVRDNGAGFDPQYQSKLFGVFQRLHRADEFAGTGVGLALVQRIVTRHGGRIWADSKPNEGATFYFTLPKEVPDGSH